VVEIQPLHLPRAGAEQGAARTRACVRAAARVRARPGAGAEVLTRRRGDELLTFFGVEPERERGLIDSGV
jgi:hypothetical protein